jgi:hypothetical protein
MRLQEAPGWLGLFFVGKLDDEGYGEDSDADSDYTLNDEDP